MTMTTLETVLATDQMIEAVPAAAAVVVTTGLAQVAAVVSPVSEEPPKATWTEFEVCLVAVILLSTGTQQLADLYRRVQPGAYRAA
jgi:hypothetical protein